MTADTLVHLDADILCIPDADAHAGTLLEEVVISDEVDVTKDICLLVTEHLLIGTKGKALHFLDVVLYLMNDGIEHLLTTGNAQPPGLIGDLTADLNRVLAVIVFQRQYVFLDMEMGKLPVFQDGYLHRDIGYFRVGSEQIRSIDIVLDSQPVRVLHIGHRLESLDIITLAELLQFLLL